MELKVLFRESLKGSKRRTGHGWMTEGGEKRTQNETLNLEETKGSNSRNRKMMYLRSKEERSLKRR